MVVVMMMAVVVVFVCSLVMEMVEWWMVSVRASSENAARYPPPCKEPCSHPGNTHAGANKE